MADRDPSGPDARHSAVDLDATGIRSVAELGEAHATPRSALDTTLRRTAA
ncbi:hypothetical protein LHJ74_19760 [Streptomyces sp. N2-109]|uniref:FXSXX-COOH protein n=1 Tax=Streptomyces gossypii TaxID=2883101 RepID=A0ABT2JW31_9ACTN|nr:hypothetical protein [Streptomyces gossypii]MCT2592112.1 hypothetical protein [Streptomyces gossypii]